MVSARVSARDSAPADIPLSRRFRYPASRRLRKRRDFLRVQDKNARVTTRHFVLLLAPRPAKGPCRLGVVASKKIGGAVVRNRAKRLLREVFRTRPGLFPDDIDLVVIARTGAADLTCAAAHRELENISQLIGRRARDVRQSRDAGRDETSRKGPAPSPKSGSGSQEIVAK